MSNNKADMDLSDDEEVSEEYSLLFSVDPGPRIFVLNNSTNTTLLGVLMDESEDSFLVAIPSRLVDADGQHEIRPFIPMPYMRLMKSSVLSVLYLYGEFTDKYSEYLIQHGKSIYPDMAEVIDDIKEQMAEEMGESAEDDIGISDLNLNTNSGVKEKAQGMSDEELKTYLMNKYSNGGKPSGSTQKH